VEESLVTELVMLTQRVLELVEALSPKL
jgi:hypothetical protein